MHRCPPRGGRHTDTCNKHPRTHTFKDVAIPHTFTAPLSHPEGPGTKVCECPRNLAQFSALVQSSNSVSPDLRTVGLDPLVGSRYKAVIFKV